MSVVANVAINIDASGAVRQLKGVEDAVGRVSKSATELPNRISSGLQGVGQQIQNLGSKFGNLSGAIASLGAGAALKSFVSAGVEAERTGKKIDALAKSYGEVAGVNKIAGDAAKQFGMGQTAAANAVADLYGRLRPMGISLKDIGSTFNGVGKAAALMNLSTADTEGVMLQLSQAMGSGRLQGDELRSVMERLPAVGQAIAKTMGVSVGEIKELGAAGALTTDVILKAMAELNKIQPPPPDAVKLYQKATEDLATAVGTKLMPVFTPLLQGLTSLITGFSQLPQPLQNVIIAVGAFTGALVLIAAPLGFALQGIGALVSAAGALAGIQLGATIAGWAGAIGPAIASLGTLGQVLISVFSGPVGWVALAVAAGVAIYTFRDQIGQAFRAIGGYLSQAAQGFKLVFIDPVVNGLKSIITAMTPIMQQFTQAIQGAFKAAWDFVKSTFIDPVSTGIKTLYDGIVKTFAGLKDALARPFQAAFQTIKGIVNQVLNAVGGAIRSVVNAINSVIRGANGALARLKLPQIPMLPAPSIPQFAKGGVVTGPTLAMVGEGGEPEYIVPQSKADGFAANWMAGRRGSSAIPAMANGGVAMPASAQVSIQTGPVTQMNGTQYVTTQDMSRAVQAGVQQTLSLLRNDTNTRRAMGIA